MAPAWEEKKRKGCKGVLIPLFYLEFRNIKLTTQPLQYVYVATESDSLGYLSVSGSYIDTVARFAGISIQNVSCSKFKYAEYFLDSSAIDQKM